MSPSLSRLFLQFRSPTSGPVAALLVLPIALAGLSGCVLLHGSAFATSILAPNQRHFQFHDDAGLHSTLSVAYRDPWNYEEYDALGGDGRAEVIFSVANGPQTALDFPVYRLRWLTRSWVYNHHAAIDWGAKHYLKAGPRRLTYAFYRHRSATGEDRRCMAFSSAWDTVPDDPRKRPRQAFFGYYCAPDGQRLTSRRAETLLRSIRTDVQNLQPVYFGQRLPNDDRARRTASGQVSGAMAGNMKFPLQFGTQYMIENSGKAFE